MPVNHAFFSLLAVSGAMLFFEPLQAIARELPDNNLYSHLPLIPLVSAGLVAAGRKKIFAQAPLRPHFGAGIAALAVLAGLRFLVSSGQPDGLSVPALAYVAFINAAFLVSYGKTAFTKALFPLFFLFFAVPLPALGARGITGFLQRQSADLSGIFFKLADVSHTREGMIFHLPGLSIEVAENCSGIRSSIALLLTGVLAAHLFLRTIQGKLVLVLLVVPLAVTKNAIRIVTLSLLGAYVDRRWLTDSLLHNRGGIVFFLVSCLMLGAMIMVISRLERHFGRPDKSLAPEGAV